MEAPIWLALTMARKPLGGGEGALKLLLAHRICPGETAQCSGWTSSDLWCISDAIRSKVLERVFYACEQRCRCDGCESKWACLDRIAEKRRVLDLSL